MQPHRALLAAVLALSPLIANAAEAWVASGTEKIRPDAPARSVTSAHLSSAKNEFQAFQVVVTGPARGVSARVSGLDGLDTKLYRVDNLSLAQPSAADGGTGSWPDALVPDVDDVVGEQRNAFPFDVGTGESRAIWVEVRVPAGARAGAVSGAVTVSTADGQARIPVTVDVWNFALPSTSSLRSSFGLSYGVVAAAHGVSGDADAQLRARYGQLALDHRITLTGLNDDGTNESDTDHFDRFYGPLVAGTAPTRLAGAKLTSVKYVGDRTSVDAHALWAKHARAGGWFDRLFDYTCDEPPLTCSWSDIPPRAAAAHAADPAFRTLVTTQLWDAQGNGVDKDIDIMVPVVNWTDDKPGSPVAGDQRARYDGFLSSGPTKELWLYQSCMSHGCGGTVNIGSPSESDLYFTGWPSYMIDASASRNRAMEWISFLEKASGELYWETAYSFRQDPWTSQWAFSGNGDGTLFYPGTPARIGGKTDIPLASIRVKMIRAGMQDYEYLKLLSDAGDPALARKIASELFPDAWSTDVPPEKIEAARARLAARIVELGGGKISSAESAGQGGGGCGSAGGLGAGALLALPLLLARVRRRR